MVIPYHNRKNKINFFKEKGNPHYVKFCNIDNHTTNFWGQGQTFHGIKLRVFDLWSFFCKFSD